GAVGSRRWRRRGGHSCRRRSKRISASTRSRTGQGSSRSAPTWGSPRSSATSCRTRSFPASTSRSATPTASRPGPTGSARAAWAASLGEHARLITKVGDDEAGRRLVSEIEAAGVQVIAVRGPEPTGAVAVLVGDGGTRSFARQRGAAVGLRTQELTPAWFDGVRLLHVPAYSLFQEPLAASARRAVDLTRARGGLISIDLSSAADLRAYGGARMAADLAGLQPELVFATESEVAEVGAPLRGLAKVPVV